MTAALPARLTGFLRRFRSGTDTQAFVFHQENVLGTSFELRVWASDAPSAEDAERRALAEIDRLERVFSSFDPTSEFRQWQNRRGQETVISPELREVLQISDRWQTMSEGAFNPASEAFSQIWKKAAREGRPPLPEALAVCASQAARPLWRLNSSAQTATYLTECPLTLNAIAKGYIVDRACDAALKSSGDVSALTLNIGGDLRVCGDRTYTIGVTDPDNDAENAPLFARVNLQNGALATSGDWRRGFRIGETFLSHIVDPRTGMPVEAVRSASVFAPSAVDADTLATVFSVLTSDESVALADSLPSAGCLLIARDGQVWRSAAWREREVIEG
jgi:thiamine biosynthesis lipoprotein ApbE